MEESKMQLLKSVNEEIVEAIDYLIDEILITDKDTRVVAVTPSCREMYGLDPAEVMGTTILQMEKDGVHFPSVAPIVLSEKKKVTVLQTTQYGKKVLVTGVPVFDDNGEIYRVVLNCRDVTDILELRYELKKSHVFIEGISPERQHLYPLNIVASSPAMKRLMTMVNKIANVDCNVLITGESGSGKEIIAKQIHMRGGRQKGAFVHINCSAIPEPLLESELFGYEAGAFTGADKKGKPGMFEIANNGTLFLDEIGEMSLALQAKLLKAIEDRQIMRLGGTKPKGVNCRILAATNRNLSNCIKEGIFREDLFYRLNVVPLYIPPLRERKEDIAPLVNLFLDVKGKTYSRRMELPKDGMKLFLNHSWPGNVRELSNVVERLVVLAEHDKVTPEEIKECISIERISPTVSSNIQIKDIMPLKEAADELEKNLLKMARERYDAVPQMAEALGVDQTTVYRKMKKYGLI